MKRDRQTVNLRHAEMLAMIRDRQEILVDELARAFDVSAMTVRRDLQTLEEQGKISRFHGGATVDVRVIAPDEKNRVAQCQRLIARCAAALVNSGDTLLINGSNTALAAFPTGWRYSCPAVCCGARGTSSPATWPCAT